MVPVVLGFATVPGSRIPSLVLYTCVEVNFVDEGVIVRGIYWNLNSWNAPLDVCVVVFVRGDDLVRRVLHPTPLL